MLSERALQVRKACGECGRLMYTREYVQQLYETGLTSRVIPGQRVGSFAGDLKCACTTVMSLVPAKRIIREQYRDFIIGKFGSAMLLTFLLSLPAEMVAWENSALVKVDEVDGELIIADDGVMLMDIIGRMAFSGSYGCNRQRLGYEDVMNNYAYLTMLYPDWRGVAAVDLGPCVTYAEFFSYVDVSWLDWQAMMTMTYDQTVDGYIVMSPAIGASALVGADVSQEAARPLVPGSRLSESTVCVKPEQSAVQARLGSSVSISDVALGQGYLPVGQVTVRTGKVVLILEPMVRVRLKSGEVFSSDTGNVALFVDGLTSMHLSFEGLELTGEICSQVAVFVESYDNSTDLGRWYDSRSQQWDTGGHCRFTSVLLHSPMLAVHERISRALRPKVRGYVSSDSGAVCCRADTASLTVDVPYTLPGSASYTGVRSTIGSQVLLNGVCNVNGGCVLVLSNAWFIARADHLKCIDLDYQVLTSAPDVELPDGQCYLRLIRSEYRVQCSSQFGSRPALNEFVAGLRGDYLDYQALDLCNVYRVESDFDDLVLYHIAPSLEIGVLLGTARDFLAMYLRYYPFLNRALDIWTNSHIARVPYEGYVGTARGCVDGSWVTRQVLHALSTRAALVVQFKGPDTRYITVSTISHRLCGDRFTVDAVAPKCMVLLPGAQFGVGDLAIGGDGVLTVVQFIGSLNVFVMVGGIMALMDAEVLLSLVHIAGFSEWGKMSSVLCHVAQLPNCYGYFVSLDLDAQYNGSGAFSLVSFNRGSNEVSVRTSVSIYMFVTNCLVARTLVVGCTGVISFAPGLMTLVTDIWVIKPVDMEQWRRNMNIVEM